MFLAIITTEPGQGMTDYTFKRSFKSYEQALEYAEDYCSDGWSSFIIVQLDCKDL